MKVAILGAGESGIGAALLAQHLGYNTWLSDAGSIGEEQKKTLTIAQVPFEEGQHTWEQFFDSDVVVKSPGIPPTAAFVQRLKEIDIEVISEIEFAARHTQTPIIAITGSNGKTTTASLIHHLLISAGVNAGLGGNIGVSMAKLLLEAPREVFVLELSSYQLEDIKEFSPSIALFLNLTPDHLDRYDGNLDLYGQAKLRITENQSENDTFIFSLDDPESQRLLGTHTVHARKKGFSLEPAPDSSAWINNQQVMIEGEVWVSVDQLPLIGPHNQRNILAAFLAVRSYGLAASQVLTGISTFRPITHRLQPIDAINDVFFVNDSKATNVDAVQYALEAMDTPVVWLAGGVDKGNDYQPLLKLISDKVKVLIILGDHDEKLRECFHGEILQVHSMKEAVVQAMKLAQSGDTVLLSPACASFDLFRNYEDRGNQFIESVEELRSQTNS